MSTLRVNKIIIKVMVGECSGGMEADEEKKLNEDLVVFMRKRSETDAPRYTARLKTYVDFQQKRRRAAAARRHTEYVHTCDKNAAGKKKADSEQLREKSAENTDNRGAEDDRLSKRRGGEKCSHRPRSLSQSRSDEPVDACKRRRRRSCRRRSRRRRSCRRRRRSCSRRRRRRSCRRRRRRRRRCR